MAANLQLSPEESALVMDAGWILTKNSVMEKVVGMMAGLSERWGAMLVEIRRTPPISPSMLALHIIPIAPKISKGEQYRGLPWVMLDCPREFGKTDAFAIRTMFWWGHEFSVTLHVKGIYCEVAIPLILQAQAALLAAGFELGVSSNEWEHGHIPENYRPWTSAKELQADRPFFKLSARIGLEHWDEAPERLSALYSLLLEVLTAGEEGEEAGK